MKIAIASIATHDMDELTNITWPNKLEYCRKHNYYGILQSQTWDYLGFDKIIFIDSLLESNQYDWILWLDNDTLFTNFNKKIEDVIDNNFHFIMATDTNGPNAGVFLVKNSEQGRAYIKHLKQKMYELKPVNKYLFGEEQTAIQATYQDPNYSPYIKILPQKYINAYPYKLYGHPNGQNDTLGVNGNWENGDFILHIPGFGPDRFHQRLDHFKHYINDVIK